MKTRFNSLALAVMLAFSVPVAVHLTGCSTTQQQQSIKALASVGSAVDTAYMAYMDLIVQGTLVTNSVPRVSEVYSKFQIVFGAATVLITAHPTNAIPPNVLAASSDVFTAINTAKVVDVRKTK